MTATRFDILSNELLSEFIDKHKDLPKDPDFVSQKELPVDYFDFYNVNASVFSSRIEGEAIDFDSFFKHKFTGGQYRENYTQKADDLFDAYKFIANREINFGNLLQAHEILSRHLLQKIQRGKFRTQPVFVVDEEGKIAYVTASQDIIEVEMTKLINDIDNLSHQELSVPEIFYYAAYMHLVLVKIHPFQDGNGRMGRLLEKWFLMQKLGKKAMSISLEKNYFNQLEKYYANIRKIGLEYEDLDYHQAFDFLSMTGQFVIKNRANEA